MSLLDWTHGISFVDFGPSGFWSRVCLRHSCPRGHCEEINGVSGFGEEGAVDSLLVFFFLTRQTKILFFLVSQGGEGNSPPPPHLPRLLQHFLTDFPISFLHQCPEAVEFLVHAETLKFQKYFLLFDVLLLWAAQR